MPRLCRLTAALTLCAAFASPRLSSGAPHQDSARAAPHRPRPAEPRLAEPSAAALPPKRQISVLLVGDSLMATALGQQLEAYCATIAGIRCHRVARSATGLARPDTHDWPAIVAKAVKRHEPAFSVVLIGSNDGQDLQSRRTKPRRHRPIHWGDAGWPAAYRGRVGELLTALGAPQRPVLWLGLPPMRSRSLETKLAVIRREQRAAVHALGPPSQYVGLVPYVRELRDQATDKARREPFAADGVHFTLGGAIRFRRLLEPLLFAWLVRVMAGAPADATPPR